MIADFWEGAIEFWQAGGAIAFILLIGVLLGISIFWFVRGESKAKVTQSEGEKQESEASFNERTLMLKLVGTIPNLQETVAQLREAAAIEKGKRMAAEKEHAGEVKLLKRRLLEVESNQKNTERELAKVKSNYEQVVRQRDRYRKERDDFEYVTVNQKERIVFLDAQTNVLSAKIQALESQLEAYKSYQQKQDTRPIPDISHTVDDDGNLITPVLSEDDNNVNEIDNEKDEAA